MGGRDTRAAGGATVRIVCLIRALDCGGAERQLVHLACGLRRHGHDVSVAVFYRTGTGLERELLEAGVELVDLAKRSRWDLLGPVRRLLRHVAVRDTEVVYAFLPTANVLAALLWSWRRAPAVVAGLRGTDTVRSRYDWLGRLLAAVERWLAPRCAAAVANSTTGVQQRLAQGWPRARLHLVRNGVRLQDFAFDPAARASLRSAWRVQPGERLIGFAGRLDPVKGLELLLEAVAGLRADGTRVRLVVAGDGPAGYVAALRERAAAQGPDGGVDWLGRVADMRSFYSAIDLLCLPSYTEGCSNVLGEALAAGTPAVATAVGEAPWLLGADGWLVRPGDAGALRAQLDIALAAVPPPRAAFAARAAGMLGIDAMVAATAAVLDGVVAGRRPSPTTAGRAPDVMLVTMVFPWPSEAFCGVEVRALRQSGARLRVRALRGRHPQASALLRDWDVADVDVTSASPAGWCRGLAFGLRHPLMTVGALAWLLARGWRQPRLTARCIALAPRMLEIFAECRRAPPDALYLFWGHYPAWLGHLVLRWLPGVHVAQALGAYDLGYRFAPAAAVARQAHSVWTHARCNLPLLAAQGLDPHRVRVVARALDLGQVPRPGGARDPQHLVTVARLEENKGVDDVLRMTAAVRTAGHPVRLTVIGEGPDRSRLEALAASLGIATVVTFTGGITHSAVYACLERAGLFVLLSRSPAERLPNAVKEALACGCISVVTRTPGIEDLLEGLKHPLVVGQGDWRMAARCVVGVLEQPQRFEADRERGREHMLRHFDARAVAALRIGVWTGSGPAGRAA